MTDFKDQDDLLRSKQVLEVFAIASEFCLFIDKIEQTTPDKALLFLQSILPALYLKGAMLPNVEVQDESANERFVTEEEYETLRYRLAQFFDTRDFFSTVDEVIAQSEAEVQNLEQQKKAAMQKIFSQEVRFKREDGTDYPEWNKNKWSGLGDFIGSGTLSKTTGSFSATT